MIKSKFLNKQTRLKNHHLSLSQVHCLFSRLKTSVKHFKIFIVFSMFQFRIFTHNAYTLIMIFKSNPAIFQVYATHLITFLPIFFETSGFTHSSPLSSPLLHHPLLFSCFVIIRTSTWYGCSVDRSVLDSWFSTSKIELVVLLFFFISSSPPLHLLFFKIKPIFIFLHGFRRVACSVRFLCASFFFCSFLLHASILPFSLFPVVLNMPCIA